MPSVGRAVIRVGDLNAAIDFYCRAFGFRVLFDEELLAGFRSVHVGSAGVGDAGIWLFPAPPKPSAASDGPDLVLFSEDIVGDADRCSRAGAGIVHVLSGAPGRRSVQMRDPWGTVIVLAEQPAPPQR
ncbi:VOC family protein [Mycolicibacterium houstonense]|uniref:VOC family protein n=1 Tax=Mycolicibacterium houstonense TaxID=146021 RepID=UPI000835F0C8|nr:VOC family protein [Mycolicibacterium houstonense]